ncbi:TonB-dependent copper receptor [Novispirillum itersonii]|uniref:Iron complex outermembrane receptor protein n=1 Tax=Novispirillum itersonii TaxID=189 RepID=A0A7W9ZHI6_NOVIT|nr:TonB-dependent copper receptor [Novispirillum itersonii]MBB6211583.1 iron complex outermembrane receptor protein [Novispirillum itersonii]
MSAFHVSRTVLLRGAAGCAVSLLALSTAFAQTTPSTPAEPELAPLVITAPELSEPMVLQLDPKAAQTPIPAADGGAYLKSVPGFTMIRKGGTGGEPVLRGQTGSRLNILLDDTPLLGGCAGRMDPPTTYAFPESYDSITVLKGPQSVVYGGGASAGTILFNRDTKRFDDWGMRGNASALIGGYGRNDQMLDATGGAKEGYIRAIGTHSKSDDYKDGAGRAVHSQYERTSGTALLGFTPNDDTTIELGVDVSQAEAAYADRMMDGTVFDRQDLKLDVTRRNVAPGVAQVKGQLYYNYVDHVMDRFSLRKFDAASMMAALSNPERTNQGFRLQGDFDPFAGTLLKVGFDYNQDIRTARGLSRAEYLAGVSYQSKARVTDMTFNSHSVYAELTQDLSATSRGIAGYRLTEVDVTDDDGVGTPTDSDTLHSALLRYEQDIDPGLPVTVYGALSHTQRAPDYWERSKNFALAKERTSQLDVGAVHDSGPWRVGLSGFASQTADYVLLSSTTGKNIDARTYGGEAEVAYRFLPSWRVETSLAYTYGENTTEDKPLAQIAPLEGSLGLRYDDGTFMGGVQMRAVSEQDRTDVGWGNIVGTDIGSSKGFATVGLSVGWRPLEAVTLTAGVDNLFDKTYAEYISKAGTASLAGDGYQQTTRVNEPGRTLWLRGQVRF